MENATIIQLSPGHEVSNVISYEDAFGEFSEFRGRGRARRHKRRMERIRMRRERRRARQEGRAEQQEARQSRKDKRRSRRMARKNMGDDPEQQEEGNSVSEGGAGNTDSANQNDSSQEQGQSQEQGGGQSQEQGGGGGGEEWGGGAPTMQEEGGEEESSEESSEDSGFDGGVDTQTDYSLGEYTLEDMSGLDGEDMASSFVDEEGNDGDINPKVQELVIEMTKTRTLLRIAIENDEKEAIKELTTRLEKQQDLMNGYVSPIGADGRRRGIRRRKAEVKAAARNVKREIKNRRRLLKNRGGSETPVDGDLNPKMSNNRIEVEAEEKGNFTGLNGVDNVNDYDAPPTRTIELKSNAEGDKPKMKINWTYVAVGAVIAVAGIWAYNKYVKKK